MLAENDVEMVGISLDMVRVDVEMFEIGLDMMCIDVEMVGISLDMVRVDVEMSKLDLNMVWVDVEMAPAAVGRPRQQPRWNEALCVCTHSAASCWRGRQQGHERAFYLID